MSFVDIGYLSEIQNEMFWKKKNVLHNDKMFCKKKKKTKQTT